MKSLIIYIVLFSMATYFVMLANISKNKVNKILFTIIGLGLPIIMFSLRYRVGTDYDSYILLYNKYNDETLNYLIFSRNFEIGFSIILKIAKLFNDPQVIFAIFALATIIIVYRNILNNKEKCSVSLAFFLFLFLYSANTLNIIRQMLAVVIVMSSYKYIWNRNFKKFVISILIASMFHTTALLFFPCYLINYKNNTKKQKALRKILIVVILLVVLLFNQFLNILGNVEIFDKYVSYSQGKMTNNYMFWIKLIILIVLFTFKKELCIYNDKNKLYYFFLIIDILLYFTGFISPFIKRIALYFGICEILVISQIPKVVENKYKTMSVLGSIAYGILMFTIIAYILGQANIIPYQTIIGK